MAQKLALINGLPRMVDEAVLPDIYEEYLTVVSSGAGANEINLSDVEQNDLITLPNSGTYAGNELVFSYNNTQLTKNIDFEHVGSGTKTQVKLLFKCSVGDTLVFRKYRNA